MSGPKERSELQGTAKKGYTQTEKGINYNLLVLYMQQLILQVMQLTNWH